MGSIRVSKWLQERYPELSQRQREEAIDAGLVCLEGSSRLKKGDKIGASDSLNCEKLNSFLLELAKGREIEGVKIVFEEKGFLVVDKPSGVATHPISLFDKETLTQWARYHYPDVIREFPEPQATLTPHRLDTGTSGLVIVATQREQFSLWRERFKSKKLIKTYLAWCWGTPQSPDYRCDYSIAHAVGDSRKMVALKGAVKSKPPVLEAESQVKVVARYPDKRIFLAEIECSTGVTHQVRVHMAALGFPLVGDELYDPDFDKRAIRRKFHALRAVSLQWNEELFSISDKDFRAEFEK